MIKANINQVIKEFSATLSQVSELDIATFIQHIQSAKRIFIAGRGRSGLQMSGFAMRLMHMGFSVYVIGDVTTPAIQPSDLLIIGSSSGKTASLISFAERAKAKNASIALFTLAPSSPLRTIADVTITLPTSSPKLENNTTPKATLPMGSLFELSMAILCELIVLELMALTNSSESDMFARHANME
jgi:6-phospho-3-hexuloisomerase